MGDDTKSECERKFSFHLKFCYTLIIINTVCCGFLLFNWMYYSNNCERCSCVKSQRANDATDDTNLYEGEDSGAKLQELDHSRHKRAFRDDITFRDVSNFTINLYFTAILSIF